MKRKLLSIVLAVAVVLTLCSALTLTSSADVSGTLTYKIIGNEVTITGYTGDDVTGALTIPATITGLPVTTIGRHAFSYTSITSLTVPTGVKTIEEYAFYNCQDLATINVADSVNLIGNGAFNSTKWYSNQTYAYVYVGKVLYKCTSETIKQVSNLSGSGIREDTVGIAEEAFEEIDTLETVHIPQNVEVIGEDAFKNCDALGYVSLSKKLKYIGEDAFYSCDSLATIKCNFSDDLTQMTDLTNIGIDAFGSTAWYESQDNGSVYFAKVYYRSKNSTSPIVSLKTGTKGIAGHAFYSCDYLSNVIIPSSVEHIGAYVFDDCPNLTTLSVDVNNKNYYSSGGCIIEKETGTVLYGGKSATIPEGVKVIGDSAFYGRTQLEKIDIPNGVTRIDDYAFGACGKLKTISIPSSVIEVGENAFAEDEALVTVNYSCGETERAKIYIGSYCDAFTNAKWNYHYGRKTFPDVNYGDWYGTSVEYAVGAALITGYKNGKFGTADGIQRQDFIVILSRLSGENIDYYAGKANFKDVSAGAYYANALAWAKARGVSTGYVDGRFGVGDKVTREQIVTFLYNFAKLKGYGTEISMEVIKQTKSYPDYKSISTYAANPVAWGIGCKIISGKSVNGKKYIAPGAPAQRSEVAAMFYNIFKNQIFTEPAK